MNQDSIETFMRSPGATASRRDFARALAGAGLGALIGSASSALDADAGKKRDKKRKTRTVTRTVRGSTTRTFTSTAPMTIPKDGSNSDKGPANPYPSTIEVSGFTNGVITDVDLLLFDVTHVQPEDIDILLTKYDGRRALVMSDVGVNTITTNIDLTLDDEATASLPQTPLDNPIDSGTFRPTNYLQPGVDSDAFAAPAPVPDGNVALNTFDGANPNGTWQLWVMDDENSLVGDLRGWALRITADVDTGTVDEQVPVTKDKKKRKRRR